MSNNELNALGIFIFGGSATFGAEAAGFKVDKVLELTDTMHLESAYHFAKNRPDIPLVLPKEWENHQYLQDLNAKDYDLIYANCPCSGLSQINKSASVDSSTNIHFYRLFDSFKEIKPKVFMIENAPRLITMGYPIIKDMLDKLQSDYKFTILRDYAGSHGVAMKRMRTMVVGWRRDAFDNKIPLVHMAKQKQMTIKEAIGDLYNVPLGSLPNHDFHPDRSWKEFEHLYDQVPGQSSILLTAVSKWDEWSQFFNKEDHNTYIKQIEQAIEKKKDGKNIWDKSPWRTGENNAAPSLTSVTELIHPIHSRPFTIREYARLMGFPDDFVFYTEETNTDIIQALAQGVPAPFVKYITGEISEALNGNRALINNDQGLVNFQHHTKGLHKTYTYDEMKLMTGLDVDKSFDKLEQ
ncbi:Modification methylase HaeIII [compost metagenome]